MSEESDPEEESKESTPTEVKQKRRSSSIPANNKIHRVHSLPQIAFDDDQSNGKQSNDKNANNEENGKEEESKEIKEIKVKKIKEEEKWEEAFYYYFEGLLSQKIEIMQKTKKNLSMPNPVRSRFLSIDNLM